MNIALFGGTFDPVHTAHVRAARAAVRQFQLDQVLFVPSGNPPHKPEDQLTPFPHRYAMVALACGRDRRLVPSLLEAPRADGRPQYSVETVRAVKASLGPKDRLYFLLGLDSFLDLPHWKQYRRLLELVSFIVVSRPGFHLRRVPRIPAFRLANVHWLRGVRVPLASREIREAVRAGRRVTGVVPLLVEEYIEKEGLYRPGHEHPQKPDAGSGGSGLGRRGQESPSRERP